MTVILVTRFERGNVEGRCGFGFCKYLPSTCYVPDITINTLHVIIILFFKNPMKK